MLICAVGPKYELKVWENHLQDIQKLVSKGDSQGLIDKFKAIVPNYHQDLETGKAEGISGKPD
jgi:hypothetical protein